MGKKIVGGLEGNLVVGVIDSDDLKCKLYEKFEEIIRIEIKFFIFIWDVKGFLLKKKSDLNDWKDDLLDSDDSDFENVNVESIVFKWSEIFFNIEWFCRNESLVENFICDVFKEDFVIDFSEYDENDNVSGEDNEVVK